MAFISNSQRLLDSFKTTLEPRFDVKLFGKLSSFIGWKIRVSDTNIFVSQERYCKELLEKYGIAKCLGTCTPMSPGVDATPRQNHEGMLRKVKHSEYCTQIGKLLYLATCTRLDICFTVCALARSVHDQTERHVKAV